MGITWFNYLDELLDAIYSPLPSKTLEEIVSYVEDILIRHIRSDIYGAYTPKEGAWVGGTTYQRRHLLESNIKWFTEENTLHETTLVVTSDAPAGQSVVYGYNFSNEDSGFLQLLESGHMGIWRNGFARPAVSNAQKEVDNSLWLQKSVESEIEKFING